MTRARALPRLISRTIARAMNRSPMLGENLAASNYTLSVNGGTGTATESPTGQLNLTGDGTNAATADKSFATIVGRRYRLTYNSAGAAPGAPTVGVAQGGSTVAVFSLGAGFCTGEFTATATTTWLRFPKIGAVLWTVTGIELREIPAV